MTRFLLAGAAALALVAGTACEPSYGARRVPASVAGLAAERPSTASRAANPVDSEPASDGARTPAPERADIPSPAPPTTSPAWTTPPAGWSWERDGCSSATFTNEGDSARWVLIHYGPVPTPFVRAHFYPGASETFTFGGLAGVGLVLMFVDGELADTFTC